MSQSQSAVIQKLLYDIATAFVTAADNLEAAQDQSELPLEAAPAKKRATKAKAATQAATPEAPVEAPAAPVPAPISIAEEPEAIAVDANEITPELLQSLLNVAREKLITTEAREALREQLNAQNIARLSEITTRSQLVAIQSWVDAYQAA